MRNTKILKLGVPPKLELPDDPERLEQLREKLREYEQRSSEEARYKALLLEELLKKKVLRPTDLGSFLETKFGPDYNRILFYESCNVVDDYCKTGGTRTIFGSGLPAAK